MNPSLSVIVPLHNVQSTVADTVEELLEILPELTPRFEMILVDDGSTDATRETACELSVGYPQVQMVIQSARLGTQASLRGAMRFSHGDLLLCCTDRPEFDLHEIRKLWDRRADNGAVWGRCTGYAPMGSIPQPPGGSARSFEAALPDLLLVPRRLLAAWQARGERQDVLAHLRERGYAEQGVELRRRRSFGGLARPAAANGARLATRPIGRFVRPTVDPVEPPLRRPNLLEAKRRTTMRDE